MVVILGIQRQLITKIKNIAFTLKGNVALEMFDVMELDIRDACTAASGVRIRSKDRRTPVLHLLSPR